MLRLHWLAVFVLILTSCNHNPVQTGKKTITVSILPEKYFVEKIAGDRYMVNVMIPPGASPVTYEPSPQQMTRLGRSEMYFRIGKIVFEDVWMDKIAELNPRLQIIDLSAGIPFIRDEQDHESHMGLQENADPHIWLSPANVKIIAKNILDALVTKDPSDSAAFGLNYRSFLKEINETDSMYQAHADQLRGFSFLIYHPALTYLARDYDMDQIVLEFEGKEPPPAYIRQVIQTAREKKIRKIFIQKQFNTDNAKSLAAGINAEIVSFDPLAEDWEKEMEQILNDLINE